MRNLTHVFEQNECVYCRLGMAFQFRPGEICPVRSRILKSIDDVIRDELVEAVVRKHNPNTQKGT